MADVKREIKALGQKVTGLKAGDNVTLVLKPPKPTVDATSAKNAAKTANDNILSAKEAIGLLKKARDMASGGNADGAKKLVDQAKGMMDTFSKSLTKAK